MIKTIKINRNAIIATVIMVFLTPGCIISKGEMIKDESEANTCDLNIKLIIDGKPFALKYELKGVPIKEINRYEFDRLKGLSDLTIPDCINKIYTGAFAGCKDLINIHTAEKNAYYTSIDGVLFSKDKKTLISYPSGRSDKYTIPDGVNRIQDEAFLCCTGLKDIIFPVSVAVIGNNAFAGCTGLTGIKLSAGVTVIGRHAFSGCTSLKSAVIPDTVTTIEEYAFSGCYALKSAAIPQGIKTIEEYTFSACIRLEKVIIPDSVTTIKGGAFNGCNKLKEINLPGSIITIGPGAFSGCNSLKSVVIPASTTTIKEYAFFGCSGLKNITIPGSVKIIGDDVFFNCRSLVINGEAGSAAERYAIKNNLQFKIIKI